MRFEREIIPIGKKVAIRKFLFLPKTLPTAWGSNTEQERWLEWATIMREYSFVRYSGYYWRDLYWVDE